MLTRSHVLTSLLALALWCGACSSPASRDGNESAGETSLAIVNGTQALDYPEAALVEMLHPSGDVFAACSASVIAPYVVLTAGHCVDGVASWQITAPYADGQTANASAGVTFDWHEANADQVNPAHHDIGLVFLETAIVLRAYPQIAKRPVSDGTSVVNIGRILNGVIARHNLYAGAPVTVTSGAGVGFPFDYNAKLVIEAGDSGGPVEMPGRAAHLIVAVNSGSGKSNEVLARVDLVNAWIQAQIDAHGGGGADGDPTLGIGSAPALGAAVIAPGDVTGTLAPIAGGHTVHIGAVSPSDKPEADDAGGCAVAGSAHARGRVPWALLSLALLFARRRRGSSPPTPKTA